MLEFSPNDWIPGNLKFQSSPIHVANSREPTCWCLGFYLFFTAWCLLQATLGTKAYLFFFFFLFIMAWCWLLGSIFWLSFTFPHTQPLWETFVLYHLVTCILCKYSTNIYLLRHEWYSSLSSKSSNQNPQLVAQEAQRRCFSLPT